MKHELEDYRKIGKKLKERLELETDIAAQKFIKGTSEIPTEFIQPLRDLNKKMTICMAISEAQRNGKNIAITPYDSPCTPSSVIPWLGEGGIRPGPFKKSGGKRMGIHA